MRGGEVAGNREPGFKALVGVELSSVVKGDRLEQVRLGCDDSAEGRVGLRSRAPTNLGGSSQTSLSFNQGQNALQLTGTHHSVAFPVTKLGLVLCALRPVGDRTFSFETSSVILAPVMLSTLFGIDPESFEDPSTVFLVLSDHSVDRGNADGELTLEPKNIASLVGTEVVGQELLDLVPLRL